MYYDDDAWILGVAIFIIIGCFGLLMVWALEENNKDYKFEQRCEQVLDGHVENSLCVKGDEIIERQTD